MAELRLPRLIFMGREVREEARGEKARRVRVGSKRVEESWWLPRRELLLKCCCCANGRALDSSTAYAQLETAKIIICRPPVSFLHSDPDPLPTAHSAAHLHAKRVQQSRAHDAELVIVIALPLPAPALAPAPLNPPIRMGCKSVNRVDGLPRSPSRGISLALLGHQPYWSVPSRPVYPHPSPSPPARPHPTLPCRFRKEFN